MNNEPTENSAPRKKHKPLIVVLAILAVLIGTGAGFTIRNAGRNKNQMNIAAQRVLDELGREYNITKKDCGEYEKMRFYGVMGFTTEQYEVEGMGNLCIMRANAGVMQMLTVILTPVQKDLPLISADYMYVMGRRTAYIEVYDLNAGDSAEHSEMIERFKAISSDYKTLTDTTPSPAWYDRLRTTGCFKNASAKEDKALLSMLDSYITELTKSSVTTEPLPEEKLPRKINAVEGYTHRLISEGGVSTDIFKDKLGEEKTTEFFDTVMFGTGRYRKDN